MGMDANAPMYLSVQRAEGLQNANAPKTQTLPTDSAERKEYPLADGLLAYFPAALAGVAKVSKEGNDKHNPGQTLHHARGKSGDHANCVLRHMMDVNDMLAYVRRTYVPDTCGVFLPTPEIRERLDAMLAEVSCMAWRALALSQELHEQFGAAPLAPGARK